ncbi:MAG: pilus motility taxis protein HmpF [Geitlerinemataceae cyanobacterium]
MQYLAEVQKKSGVFGGGKAELKLLAFQRGESWTAVPGEETIPADEAGNFNSGALVLAEVNANKQLQGTPKEAGRQIVSILQNYSRLQDKTKTQEEEIEQWKQSLTYQSQELNRREMEMQAQLEQFEQMGQELDQLEAKRSEIAASEQESQQLREEMERQQQELESAWEQLRGQQDSTDSSSSGMLDTEQVHSIQEWLNYLAQVVVTPEAVQEPLNSSLEKLAAQRATLEERWQMLEQQRNEAGQQQEGLEGTAQELESQWQQWHAAGSDLERVKSELAVQQSTLELEQRLAQVLRSQLQSQEALTQQLSQLSAAGGSSGPKVDVSDLEGKSLHELQRRVRKAREELGSNFPFVSDQEEELTLQRQDIDDLIAKMKNTFGGEREGLEKELADQEEGYKFLNETLVGQWRNLQDRQRVLEQHQIRLWQRLGNPDLPGDSTSASVNVEPLLRQLEELRQQQQAELQTIEARLEQMQQGFEEAQASVNASAADRENQLNELKQKERQLQDLRVSVAQLWGQVNASEEILQPIQDSLNELQQYLEAVAGGTAHIGEMSEAQNNAIAQLQESVAALTGNSAAVV